MCCELLFIKGAMHACLSVCSFIPSCMLKRQGSWPHVPKKWIQSLAGQGMKTACLVTPPSSGDVAGVGIHNPSDSHYMKQAIAQLFGYAKEEDGC